MFKWLNSKKKDNKGFTLVELVIVVAILAILVGLLAPQYTKYVEKSRKAADASNMDEIVKVIKVYAADPANELEMGTYTITMSNTKTAIATLIGSTKGTVQADGKATEGLAKELQESIPDWWDTKVKSQKWGANGAYDDIIATVTVAKDGGTSVAYTTTKDTATTNKFATYMKTGA